MEESRTWRDLLARIINDPQEKRRIADAVIKAGRYYL